MAEGLNFNFKWTVNLFLYAASWKRQNEFNLHFLKALPQNSKNASSRTERYHCGNRLWPNPGILNNKDTDCWNTISVGNRKRSGGKHQFFFITPLGALV